MLKVVIQAFIHGNEPSAVRLSRGVHATRTAIPLPLTGYLPPLNWGKPFMHVGLDGVSLQGVGYLTDLRDFAPRPNMPNATQRMQSMIEINPRTGEIVSSHHVASPTIEVDLFTGAQRATSTADLVSLFGVFGLSKWTRMPSAGGSNLGPHDRRHAYALDAQGSDPLVSLAWLRPIQYGGDLVVTLRHEPATIDVTFHGYATHFPCFEGFVQYGGQTEILFRVAPPAGKDVSDLLSGKQAGRLSGHVRLSLSGTYSTETV